MDKIHFSTGAAEGSAGSATSTGYSLPVSGEVLAVYVKYLDSPPAGTTDFTLTSDDDPAGESIVTLADTATNIKVYPGRVLETNDGTDVTYDGSNKVYTPYVVHGRLKATIAQANAGDSCEVTVWLKT